MSAGMMLVFGAKMSKLEINVRINHRLAVSLEDKWIKKIIQLSLEAADVSPPVEVGLFITDSETVRKLNRNYRGKDEPTDVLAFHTQPCTAQKGSTPNFVMAPDGVQHLGEVVISYPQAVIQAEQHKHEIEQELSLLIVHGVLHLLGYDHEQPEGRRLTRAKETEILKKLE